MSASHTDLRRLAMGINTGGVAHATIYEYEGEVRVQARGGVYVFRLLTTTERELLTTEQAADTWACIWHEWRSNPVIVASSRSINDQSGIVPQFETLFK